MIVGVEVDVVVVEVDVVVGVVVVVEVLVGVVGTVCPGQRKQVNMQYIRVHWPVKLTVSVQKPWPENTTQLVLGAISPHPEGEYVAVVVVVIQPRQVALHIDIIHCWVLGFVQKLPSMYPAQATGSTTSTHPWAVATVDVVVVVVVVEEVAVAEDVAEVETVGDGVQKPQEKAQLIRIQSTVLAAWHCPVLAYPTHNCEAVRSTQLTAVEVVKDGAVVTV